MDDDQYEVDQQNLNQLDDLERAKQELQQEELKINQQI